MDCENCTRCHVCGKPMESPEPADSGNVPPNNQVEPPAAVDAPSKCEELSLSPKQPVERQEPSVDLETSHEAASFKKSENEMSESKIHDVQPEPKSPPVANGNEEAATKPKERSPLKIQEAAEGPSNEAPVKPAPPVRDFKTVERLKEVLNGEVEPCDTTCSSCRATLNDAIDKKINETEREINGFKVYLLSREKNDAEDEEPVEDLQKELALIEEKGRQLDILKRAVDVEREEVYQERDKEREKVKELERLERLETIQTLREEEKQNAAKDELISLHNQVEYVEEQLELLKEINPIAYLFDIDCTYDIGKINGFYLGGVSPDKKNEALNLAWGESVRLLALIKKKLGIQLEKYVLLPYGALSHITTLKDLKIKLHLYLPEKAQGSSKVDFDKAQAAFLDCMWQMELKIQLKHKKSFKLINPITNSLIRDGKLGLYYSIKKRSNTNASWTKALNCMLVNLKQLLDFYLELSKNYEKFEIPALEEFVE